jgi:integrase
MIIRVHLIPHFESMHLKDITTAMIQRYIAKKLETLSPKSVVNHLVPLKEMLKHATRWGYLKHNPADYAEKPRVEREEMEFLTPEEIRAFLQEVRPKRYVFFLMAVLTGCGRGELLGLQVGDIDFRKNQIHVRRSLWKGKFVTPKSKYSVRSIDMSPYLAHELKKHLIRKPHSDMDLVFCNEKGKPFDPDSLIKRHFLPALRRATLRMVPFHSLRHSNVALRIVEVQNIKYIQRQLGHASIQTTLDRYGHLLSETNQECAKSLDSRLGFEVDNKGRMLEKC